MKRTAIALVLGYAFVVTQVSIASAREGDMQNQFKKEEPLVSILSVLREIKNSILSFRIVFPEIQKVDVQSSVPLNVAVNNFPNNEPTREPKTIKVFDNITVNSVDNSLPWEQAISFTSDTIDFSGYSKGYVFLSIPSGTYSEEFTLNVSLTTGMDIDGTFFQLGGGGASVNGKRLKEGRPIDLQGNTGFVRISSQDYITRLPTQTENVNVWLYLMP